MKNATMTIWVMVVLLGSSWLARPALADGAWNIQTVDSTGNVGLDTSIALDAGGNAHISYYDLTNRNLKYAAWNGSAWDINTVDSTGNVGWSSSIVLDAGGNAHISYNAYTNDDLKYAAFNGSTWNIQTVDSTGDVGGYTSIALDAGGNAHISYTDETNDDLKYAAFNGSTWDIQTVDSTGRVGWYTSIALDAGSNPHISYYDVTNRNLKYAAWNGSAWDINTVDSTGWVGYDTSIALDASGNPHISYFDSTNIDLKYAVYVPEPALAVKIDIKPGSCPNPVNVKSSGVLPIAILGTENVNVLDIDPTSIAFSIGDVNVGAIRRSYEDVATPVSDSNDCNCTEDGPDGFLDLTLKFEMQRIVGVIGEVNDGDELTLELTGVLADETHIEGSDCVIILGRHKPINKADFNGDGIVDMADFAAFAENWLQLSIVEY